MTEKYKGVKFKTIFLKKFLLKDKRIKQLIKYGKKFAKLGLSPEYDGGSAGNLSFRVKDGFIITASRSDLSKLNKRDFVKVVNCNLNKKQVFVFGVKEPSSESFLHYSIYKKRKDINAIFHCHDDDVLKCSKKMNIPETNEKQFYGTLELAKEAMKILKNNNYIILKGHGIVAMGKSVEDAGKLVLKYYEKARECQKPPVKD